MAATIDVMSQRRCILVTGAASGIGAAVCRMMAGPETAILLHTRRNRDALEAVAEQLRAAGSLTAVATGDLGDPALAAGLVGAAVRHFGQLDVLVSNAGFADRTPFANLTDAALRTSTKAIQGVFFRLCHAALPTLRAAREGRIVAVSSFVAHAFRTDVTTFPASAAAKAGLEALVRALAVELGPDGVTVNAVVPASSARTPAPIGRSIPPFWPRRPPASRCAGSERRTMSPPPSPSLRRRAPATSRGRRST